MRPRHLSSRLLAALADTPVVLLHGARQTGKSTEARALAGREPRARYVSLDEPAQLAAARNDPDGFIRGFAGRVVLDEIQHVPELFRAIKIEVDRNRKPGRFLLTGSANVLLLPRLSESLAGRMEPATLWPFSQGEIEGVREGFLDAVLSDRPLRLDDGWGETTARLLQRVLRGGFPEVVARREAERRAAWFDAYVTTVAQKDIRDLAHIEGAVEVPRLLSLLAARTSAIANYAELSRSVGLPQTTLKRYLALLQTTFLLQPLRAWSGNVSRRLIKAPKFMLLDSGLAGHLAGFDARRIESNPALAGPLIENFVVMELRKQASWSDRPPALFYFRSASGAEVDIVIEGPGGRIVGIEVKAAASVSPQDLGGVRILADETRKRFHRGILLYGGRDAVQFDEHMFALPIAGLWRLGAKRNVSPERRN